MAEQGSLCRSVRNLISERLVPTVDVHLSSIFPLGQTEEWNESLH